LSRRDYLFFAWNAAVGVLCAALVLHRPDLNSAAIPPFLWLLIGMGAFEIGAFLLARDAPILPLSNVTRFLGLSLSLGLFTVITAVLSRA
jgi:hypothetical protein